MREGPGSPSFARRMIAALARVGIDLRPPSRRARDAILRSARQEFAVQMAGLREQFGARRQRWKTAWTASVDRAFSIHADEITLCPIFDDWYAAAEQAGNRP